MASSSTSILNRFMPRTLTGRRTLVGYIFIMPFILGFLLWFLTPALVAMWLTVHEWKFTTPPKYVGLANLERMWTDDRFWISLRVTTTYTLISVPVGLLLGFLLAQSTICLVLCQPLLTRFCGHGSLILSSD